MQKIENTSFRNMYHQVVFIGDNLTIKKFMAQCDFPSEKRNGVLAYGYIDVDAGFTFEVLCNALKTDDSIELYSGNDEISVKLRRGSVADCEIAILNTNELDAYQNKIDMVHASYNAEEQLRITRNITLIDECRNADYPDDILVYVATEKSRPEGCWVRCVGIKDKSIVGTLLNEPIQDLAMHCGDKIEFGVMQQENRTICVALL